MIFFFCKLVLALSAKDLNASSAFEPIRPQISQQISFSENFFFPCASFPVYHWLLVFHQDSLSPQGDFLFGFWAWCNSVCFCAPSDTSQGVISVVCIAEGVLGGEIEGRTPGKWAVCSEKSTSPILARPWGNPELFKVCVEAAGERGGKQGEERGLLEIMAVH